MSELPTRRPNLKHLQTWRWLLLNISLLAMVGLVSLSYPVEELSRRTGDMYFRLRGSQGTSPHVALILIDDASLERYGRWPWKRSLLAQVVRAASAEHPKALGLDILLSEAEDETNDCELAKALKDAGNAVLVAKISNSPQGRLWVEPLPLFARYAVAVGHAQAALGPDSICRSVPVRELSLEGPRWAFALELVRVASGAILEDDGRALRIGWRNITTIGTSSHAVIAGVESEPLRFLPIDYRGQIAPGETSSPFVAVSVEDLLDGKAGGQLQGKVVLIGFGSTEISDRIPTPVSDKLPMPGVEIHANLIDAILAGRSLRPLNGWLNLLVLCAFSLSSTWALLRWPVWRGLVALAALLAVGVAASYFVFAWMHILVGLGPFLCVALLAGPLAQLQNLVLVDRGLTQGLRQLQNALKTAELTKKDSLPAALRAEFRRTAGDLHWKVSLLRQLQSELSSLYAFDETLLEAMQEGLAVFSFDGRVIFRNPQWQSFCEKQGCDAAAGLDNFAAALREPDWRDLRKSLATREIWLDSEVYLGEGLWRLRAVRLKRTPPSDSSDLILVVVTDLTARLERDRARAEALGFVTHELRTPLVSIQGFAEYLLRYSKERASSEAAATIFQESGRLVAMINTYLDVLRLEAGARPMRKEAFQVGETVKQVARVIQPIAQASEIKVRTEIAKDLPTLQGDPHLIEGALLNLVSNAIKYSTRGSEVKLRAEVEGDGVVLEVWNPGPAIPQGELARLFEPFYRRNEREETTRGWGLGLAFVKRIAEQHGGKTEALSEPGLGTSFRIHLPVTGLILSEVHQ
jgi:signal transduction histidine kinase/CHASE2 domain-containing sensor protein